MRPTDKDAACKRDNPMKAISLHQPWASWIALGKKTIETRTWYTHYRGDLLIASTKKRPEFYDLPLGKGLCIVRVVGCRQMRKSDEKAAMCPYEDGRYAWILENIRRIEPFAIKGSQGFYEVEYPHKEQTSPPYNLIREWSGGGPREGKQWKAQREELGTRGFIWR